MNQRESVCTFLARMVFGRRVDPDSQRVVKFFPRLIPRKGEHVLVDGARCRITFVRVGGFERIGDGLYRYRIKSLRVKDDSQ